MVARTAEAEWQGALRDGKGTVKLGSGAFSGNHSFTSRFENGKGTNPEELIGAAHAGCFSMAFSAVLGGHGLTPKRIHTTAAVHIDKVGDGFSITHIDLAMEAEIPGLSQADFQTYANDAKTNCPVSKALAGTKINLTAKLL
ncbi:MAG TPA: OsmC family protein [Dongiaceae bacterium]|jgi:osmotically inducible protein OsmC|nr:OsmC family protein [Dongiaceae bacterium]